MKRPSLYALTGMLFLLTAACSPEERRAEVVFMDSFKVFEGFEMKKDYDLLIEKELGKERSAMESLAKSLEGIRDQAELSKQKTALYERQQQFDQKFGELSDRYTQEVYARLNEYIADYGKEKGYKLILGATGDGNVMYVDTTVNVTQDLLKYANNRYNK